MKRINFWIFLILGIIIDFSLGSTICMFESINDNGFLSYKHAVILYFVQTLTVLLALGWLKIVCIKCLPDNQTAIIGACLVLGIFIWSGIVISAIGLETYITNININNSMNEVTTAAYAALYANCAFVIRAIIILLYSSFVEWINNRCKYSLLV